MTTLAPHCIEEHVLTYGAAQILADFFWLHKMPHLSCDLHFSWSTALLVVPECWRRGSGVRICEAGIFLFWNRFFSLEYRFPSFSNAHCY